MKAPYQSRRTPPQEALPKDLATAPSQDFEGRAMINEMYH